MCILFYSEALFVRIVFHLLNNNFTFSAGHFSTKTKSRLVNPRNNFHLEKFKKIQCPANILSKYSYVIRLILYIHVYVLILEQQFGFVTCITSPYFQEFCNYMHSTSIYTSRH